VPGNVGAVAPVTGAFPFTSPDVFYAGACSVNNPATGKAVYAKVLGSLPDMKESAGLSIRISDAAAAELGAAGPKFGVDIKY